MTVSGMFSLDSQTEVFAALSSLMSQRLRALYRDSYERVNHFFRKKRMSGEAENGSSEKL
jgi:hypothetical protein